MNETICAVATPLGTGGIGIVRISGPDAPRIGEQVFGRCPPPRRAAFGQFLDGNGEPIDSGIALYFAAPNSFTGEDVLELQGHGGPVVLRLLCERVQELGARLARPGEFTERAFLNDRMDLAQAEAVADLISATTAQAAKASARSLTGEFSREILEIDKEVLDLRVFVEGAIDFAEEEIDFLTEESLVRRADSICTRLQELLRRTELGVSLQQGLQVVIAGAPNVGKSSLLNALLDTERAIVTEVAGTTRDTLEGTIHLDGLPVHLTDTAGMHESDDPIEQVGMNRAREAMDKADLVLWVVDDRETQGNTTLPYEHFVVRNKCDLTNRPHGIVDDRTVRTSATQGGGLDALRQCLKQIAGFQPSDDAFAGRPRHVATLQNALQCANRVVIELKQKSGEVAAEELRSVHKSLGEVVGETTTDDLLGEIFSRFCIGK